MSSKWDRKWDRRADEPAGGQPSEWRAGGTDRRLTDGGIGARRAAGRTNGRRRRRCGQCEVVHIPMRGGSPTQVPKPWMGGGAAAHVAAMPPLTSSDRRRGGRRCTCQRPRSTGWLQRRHLVGGGGELWSLRHPLQLRTQTTQHLAATWHVTPLLSITCDINAMCDGMNRPKGRSKLAKPLSSRVALPTAAQRPSEVRRERWELANVNSEHVGDLAKSATDTDHGRCFI